MDRTKNVERIRGVSGQGAGGGGVVSVLHRGVGGLRLVACGG